ncbi:DUF6291 domain-containing protein [Pedobacter cryoconitis]|uniref:Putative virion protein n=1 Tax=Pedobacter cryoconitis TaxID=188932 RepID=A0A327SIF8_9SPHI|nr:DUF6291 domain-containing protein [Pedobacter cryoconitis]RAJ28910.1 putative virion protein [Pedobacter cryoconitis]
MADEKKSFILYADLIHTVSLMPNDKAGMFFKTILDYVNDIEPVIEELALALAFEPVKRQIERDSAKWEKTKGVRSVSGKLGGIKSGEVRRRKREAEAYEPNASLTKQAEVNEPVNVNGTVNGIPNSKVITPVVPTASIDFEKFIDGFNAIAKRKFKVTDTVKTSLKARLKKYTRKEIVAAIANAHKDKYHIDTKFKYLTPEFILRESKLEKFINQPEETKATQGYTPQMTN